MSIPLNPEELKARIALLEEQTAAMEDGIKTRIKETYSSLSPASLVKNALSGITSDSGIKSSLLNMAVTLGLGYVGGRLFWNPTGNIAKKAVGAALQLGSGKDISKQLAVWKRFLSHLFTKVKKNE